MPTPPRAPIHLDRPPPAPAGARIGLLGGSFNPAHDGHRDISLQLMRRLRLDAVWWIVTPGNPLKDHAQLAPLSDRIARAAAVADHPRIAVTGFEATLGSAYTAETLTHLARTLPAVRFVWLMGADNLAQFHRWRDWELIAATLPMAVADRPGWRYHALASPAAHRLARHRVPPSRAASLAVLPPPAWLFVDVRRNPLSSTGIRAGARAPETGD
ncbi:MAG: nicotinate-nucleotide adenylyltransferase [Rhizobiales bacterium]|nr:nicotinate-nucleotide adenylyltransferase [Hyphomicrobiales bacterium]